jgi:hypothetical protein
MVIFRQLVVVQLPNTSLSLLNNKYCGIAERWGKFNQTIECFELHQNEGIGPENYDCAPLSSYSSRYLSP